MLEKAAHATIAACFGLLLLICLSVGTIVVKSTNTNSILGTRNLQLSFTKPRFFPWQSDERVYALRNVTADFAPPGEITTFIGPSKSGKSTLAKCLLGRYPSMSGEIVLSTSSPPPPTPAPSSTSDKPSSINNSICCGGYLDHLFCLTYDPSKRVDQLLPLPPPPPDTTTVDTTGRNTWWLRDAIEATQIPTTEKVQNLLETQKKIFEVLLVLYTKSCQTDFDSSGGNLLPMLLVLDEYMDKDTPSVRKNFHRALKSLLSLPRISLQIIIITHSRGVLLECSDRVIVLQNGMVFYQGNDAGKVLLPMQLTGNMLP